MSLKRLLMRCTGCGERFDIVGSMEQIQAVAEANDVSFPCQQSPECQGAMRVDGERNLSLYPQVVVENLWKSTMGPEEEIVKSDADVAKAMVGKLVAAVHARMEDGRCVLDKIVMQDVELWLTTSGLGPVVYRIRRREDASSS
jgi:hypothetical protein